MDTRELLLACHSFFFRDIIDPSSMHSILDLHPCSCVSSC
jgi:hypothetical protein